MPENQPPENSNVENQTTEQPVANGFNARREFAAVLPTHIDEESVNPTDENSSAVADNGQFSPDGHFSAQANADELHERPGIFANYKMKRQLKIKTKPPKTPKAAKPASKAKKGGGVWGALSSFITMIVVLVLIVAGVWLATIQLFEVKNDQPAESLFLVRSGDNLTKISQRLEQQKLISSQDLYKFLVSWEGNDTRLKAGEYIIPPNATMRDIMNIFVGGQSIQHKITFAEGLTTQQILDKLKIAPLLTGEIKYTPAEGSLMPETYLFENGSSRTAILAEMEKSQKRFLADLWDTRAKDLPLKSMEEVVILASIVEKETGVARERPQVAAVFVNRILQKMRLQSDPTIIYGITKGAYILDRQLRKSEIKAKTAYNTYVINGLPPTPIANPGKQAILAVLNPADVDFLYFVADGTGGHVFAKTYKQHQKNVKKLRALEKANK
ncbi:MAG: endolytic transglycosylase MltG [Rhizobiales bacterium]|nr:endolytic transglycosylase MltG [Hyphomicrobiales bacterium]NRB12997.1 endolytic transglycosylase MltG [Hyphomicrobiales bacterium]